MGLEKLLTIIATPSDSNWQDENVAAFDALFGVDSGRYPANAKKGLKLRAPGTSNDKGVPFSAYIHPSNSDSGPYGGTSFAIFPVGQGPCLVSLVVGTHGLNPDEGVLSRPGHARKVQAICRYLNRKFGQGEMIAWAKQDPVSIDQDVSDEVAQQFPSCKSVFDRYGRVLYALFRSPDAKAIEAATVAFLDLLVEERGYEVLASAKKSEGAIRSDWFAELLPSVSQGDLVALLKQRRFVVLQGPPGTGKTRMALNLLREPYETRGRVIQFHANTTYESFVGGLAPVTSGEGIGLRFAPSPGQLMLAAEAAAREPDKPYLLVIDEINRADLAKVLGEALFLLEADDPSREIELPYQFSEISGRRFKLPGNLHVLGTMNSSDRSIALVDVAVRRRFAFAKLWPDASVVNGNLMRKAYQRLLSIFVEHASDEALDLLPGHSYFLEEDDELAKSRLKITVAPLLLEYLSQGFVGGFTEPIRTYLQWIESL